MRALILLLALPLFAQSPFQPRRLDKPPLLVTPLPETTALECAAFWCATITNNTNLPITHFSILRTTTSVDGQPQPLGMTNERLFSEPFRGVDLPNKSPFYHAGILQPGESMILPFGVYADTRRDLPGTIRITAVIFDDGTYWGDPLAVKDALDHREAFRADLARLLALTDGASTSQAWERIARAIVDRKTLRDKTAIGLVQNELTQRRPALYDATELREFVKYLTVLHNLYATQGPAGPEKTLPLP